MDQMFNHQPCSYQFYEHYAHTRSVENRKFNNALDFFTLMPCQAFLFKKQFDFIAIRIIYTHTFVCSAHSLAFVQSYSGLCPFLLSSIRSIASDFDCDFYSSIKERFYCSWIRNRMCFFLHASWAAKCTQPWPLFLAFVYSLLLCLYRNFINRILCISQSAGSFLCVI